MAGNLSDQQHPQDKRDRQIVDSLLQGELSEINLVELARLRIRYNHFPGAREIQNNLDRLLNKWQLTEEELFEKSRQIHAQGNIYKRQSEDVEDWS